MPFEVKVRHRRDKNAQPFTVQVSENSVITSQEEAEAHVAATDTLKRLEVISATQPAAAEPAKVAPPAPAAPKEPVAVAQPAPVVSPKLSVSDAVREAFAGRAVTEAK